MLRIKKSPINRHTSQTVKLSEDGSTMYTDIELIMMDWETPFMEEHAKVICHSGGDVLNIGHGMGIVDRFIQELNPRSHSIIEIHPDIQQKMLKENWDMKPNVNLYFGSWVDFLDELPLMDGIFFDTLETHEFVDFISIAWKYLKPGGVFTFFNNNMSSPENEIFQPLIKDIILDNYDVTVKTVLIPNPDIDNQKKYSDYGGYFSNGRRKYFCPILKLKNK